MYKDGWENTSQFLQQRKLRVQASFNKKRTPFSLYLLYMLGCRYAKPNSHRFVSDLFNLLDERLNTCVHVRAGTCNSIDAHLRDTIICEEEA
jgi:hypothetical protein